MFYVLCYDVQGLGLHNHDDHDHDHDHSGVETMVWKMLMTCLAIWGFFNLQAVLDTLSRAVITIKVHVMSFQMIIIIIVITLDVDRIQVTMYNYALACMYMYSSHQMP